MHVVYLSAAGPADPTRASIALHLAANGSAEVGHQATVVLAGDATELIRADVAERVEGLGLPPLRELLAKARERALPVFV